MLRLPQGAEQPRVGPDRDDIAPGEMAGDTKPLKSYLLFPAQASTRLGRCFRRLGFTYNNKDVGRKMVIGASKYSVKTAF